MITIINMNNSTTDIKPDIKRAIFIQCFLIIKT